MKQRLNQISAMWEVQKLRQVRDEEKMSESQAARTAGCRRQIRSGEDAKNDDVEEQMTPVSCRCKLIENLA